jgi:hypothetical protein
VVVQADSEPSIPPGIFVPRPSPRLWSRPYCIYIECLCKHDLSLIKLSVLSMFSALSVGILGFASGVQSPRCRATDYAEYLHVFTHPFVTYHHTKSVSFVPSASLLHENPTLSTLRLPQTNIPSVSTSQHSRALDNYLTAF